ncbi:NUDIX hydrolase [Candidatus Woesearchaeota archaeon]|nr:NUDIX hydrolase [Candidatus Woesearchaeota archaeon]
MDYAAVLMIKNRNDEILFGKRSPIKKDYPNCWALPSETSHESESPEDCAKRGAKEELGVKIKIEKILKSHTYKRDSGRDITIHIYLCSIEFGEPKNLAPEEITELKWQKLDEFYKQHSDQEIAKGLQELRKNYKELNI